MASNLEQAISSLVEQAKATGYVLNVHDAAVQLANTYGGDSREISSRITEVGIAERINMKIDSPMN